jgi:preprotein translocase subunit Sss1
VRKEIKACVIRKDFSASYGVAAAKVRPEERARMKPATIVGLLLIVLGIIGFIVGGVSFTHTKQDAKIGPVEINHQSTDTFPIPPVLSGVALLGGIGLVVVGSRSRA